MITSRQQIPAQKIIQFPRELAASARTSKGDLYLHTKIAELIAQISQLPVNQKNQTALYTQTLCKEIANQRKSLLKKEKE